MANIEKTVSIIFMGDDRLSKKIRKIENNINSFSDSAQKITQPLADIATSVLKADAAFNALVAGGLVYATKKSIEFESATVNLKKILGEQADQIDIVGNKAIELSNKYGQSSSGIIESMTDFKRAGFDLKDISTLANDSMNLVLAASEAGFEGAQATEILISTLKGFKAPASEASRIVDILNKVSNEYATSVTELGIGMSKLSPIASKMGFSFEETAGILTPVIEIFRSGDEASTALRTGLLKLIDDSAPVKKGLESIGVSQLDTNGKLKSGRDILFEVAEAFETLNEDQKLFVTQQLVGIRQAAKMVEVFDRLAYTSEITGVAMDAGGSAILEVAEKLKTGEVAIDRIVASFNNLALITGTKFKNSVADVVNGGSNIIQVLQKIAAGNTFDPIFKAINDFGEEFKKDLEIIAKNLPEAFESVDYTSLIKSYDNLSSSLKNALEAVFGDIDLSTPEGLARVINKIVDSMAALNNITSGIIDGLKPFLELIGEGIDKFGDLDEKAAKATGEILGFATGLNKILDHSKAITGFLGVLAGASLTHAATSIYALAGSFGALSLSLASVAIPVAVVGGLGWLVMKLRDIQKETDNTTVSLDEFKKTLDQIDFKAYEFEVMVKADTLPLRILEDRMDYISRFGDKEVKVAVKTDIEKIEDKKVKIKLDQESAIQARKDAAKEFKNLEDFIDFMSIVDEITRFF